MRRPKRRGGAWTRWRAAAALAVLALASGCGKPAWSPARSIPATLHNEPSVRVGVVVDRDSASVSATGQFRVIGPDGSIVAVVDSGRVWHAYPGSGAQDLRLARPDRPDPVRLTGPVEIRPEQRSTLVVIGARRYRGEARIMRGSTGVTVVNVVPMEAYLLSVVALELGFKDPAARQAVMAQAVAARTYAIKNRGRREALGFDLYPTDADQMYTGVEPESPEVDDAVGRTTGQILTYNGQPIEALFHSTCGWSTEAVEQVFQNSAPVPYLRAVSDRYGRGPRDYYCAASPKFRWTEQWDAATLTAILSQTLPAVAGARAATLGRVTNIQVTRTTPTGRVAELTITTTDGTFVVPGYHVRDVLRPAGGGQLNSTLLQLHVERQGGNLTRVVAAGAGYGHGVGMCQFGAVGRSRAGQSYRQILATYYHGTKLERAY